MSAFGQLHAELIGPLCRCLTCCCPPGRGHNHPAWQAYEAKERAREAAELEALQSREVYPWCADEAEEQARQRYHDALESGLSDYEAREEGWPSTQSDESVRAHGAETRTDQ